MSDVPLGVFLSGGLDSSSIAAMMAKLAGNTIKTFSVGYAEAAFSELSHARALANHIHSEHHEIIINCEDFWSSLPQLIWHEDEPLVWPSSVALHFLSGLAATKVKVVLTGEGADEILAGYLKYPATLFNIKYGSLYEKTVPRPLRLAVRNTIAAQPWPLSWRRKLGHTFLNHSTSFERLHLDNFYSAFSPVMRSELFTTQVTDDICHEDAYATSVPHFKQNGPGTLLSRLLYFDIKTYLPELLMKQDQMSMSASIESRVPFLDHKLVEFSASMPDNLKLRQFSGKYILKQAMKDLLPPEILHRPKVGFPTPFSRWLQFELLERTSALLTDGRLAARKIVRPEFVRDLLELHRSGRANVTDAVWRLLNFEIWNRVHVDRDPQYLAPSASLMTA
jgi:asparagine synthase (glutamine-hydrolysing)